MLQRAGDIQVTW